MALHLYLQIPHFKEDIYNEKILRSISEIKQCESCEMGNWRRSMVRNL